MFLGINSTRNITVISDVYVSTQDILSTDSSISIPDSLLDRFQCNSHWFQVDLDELYRFQTTLFSKDPPYPRKTQNTAKKCRKNRPISEILSRIRFSADYNITGTGSKQISTCSIDSTTRFFPKTPPYPSKVPNTAKNRQILVILSRIRFSTGSNITITGSNQISTSSIDSTTPFFPQTLPYPSIEFMIKHKKSNLVIPMIVI